MDPSLISITSQFDPRVAAVLGWVVVLVKVLVDWAKTAATLPRWAPPLMAFAAALAVLLVLMVAIGIGLSAQLAAQAVLAALIAAVLAIGQTALQDRTRPSEITVSAIADELEARVEARAAERAAATSGSDTLITQPPRWLPEER